MPIPGSESPMRALKRGAAGRWVVGAANRLAFGSWAPSASRRYALYAALLLVGYLAGAVMRRPVHDASQGSPLSGAVSATSSSMGVIGTTGAAAAAAASSAVRGGGAAGDSGDSGDPQHRSAKLQLQTAGLGQGSSPSLDPASEADLREAAQATAKAATAAAAEAKAAARQLPAADRTLRFQVCNGFANQRLSVLYGMLLAKHLGRAAVVPVLVDNGLQRTGDAVLAGSDNQVPFADMYDQPYFVQAMAAAGVRVLDPAEAPPLSSYTQVALMEYGWSVAEPLASRHGDVRHLAVDCVLFKIMASDLAPEDMGLVWAGLDGLRPSKEAAALVDLIVAGILHRSPPVAAAGPPVEASSASGASGSGSGSGSTARAGGFNFIHLRIENDWLEHCARWEAIADGIVRDNCNSHTDEIGARLALFGLSNSTTLYVGSYWEDVDKERQDKAMAMLAAAGYSVVTSEEVFPEQAKGAARRGREHNAMVEYFVGMKANRFIGNSVSTFAALGLMERRHRGQWAAYYNGGNIPLATMLPELHRLPWVFTYNSWSPSYEYMLKGAVRSALATRSFHPYCIFQGNASSPIAAWLLDNNVTLIRHTPAWRDQLLARARSKAKENVHHSHLFKTPDMLVSTFQRVDLPVVPILDQYTYVLYTDADVYFRKPIRLDDFGLPLPHSVSMSYEFVNMFPYNAGIMVANLPTMRQNYKAFIAMMLDNDNGLYYTNYGPADQGILNKFYEQDLRARLLSQAFNAKVYNAFDPAAFIVHFHGPKPHELINFLATGKCDFFTVCESTFMNSVCAYAREWVDWVPDHVVAVRLEDACFYLDNPTVAEVFKKKWGLAGDLVAWGGVPEDKRVEFTQADQLVSSGGKESTSELAGDEGQRIGRISRALLQQAERRSARREAQEQEQGQGQGNEQRVLNGRGGQGPRAEQAQGQMQQQGEVSGQGAEQQQQELRDFDTATAVTVDQAALEAAWSTGAEGGGQSSGSGEGETAAKR